jgi:hypothetical protein
MQVAQLVFAHGIHIFDDYCPKNPLGHLVTHVFTFVKKYPYVHAEQLLKEVEEHC